MTSKRKPFNSCAGYVASIRSGPPCAAADGGRGWVVIYQADQQGMDVGGDRFAVVCETHATIQAEPNLKGARLSMKLPAQFCQQCRDMNFAPWQRARCRPVSMNRGDKNEN